MRNSLWASIFLLVVAMIAMSACKTPAEFDLVSLDIVPPEVATGETVSVTAEVKNIGGSEGTYTAILTVDGVQVETKEVTLAPGASETVTFSLVKNIPGTYQVGIGDLSSSLTVKEMQVELKYDDGQARDYICTVSPYGFGGHIVDFTSANPFIIKKIRTVGVLSPTAKGLEGKTFDLQILDHSLNVLHTATYKYTLFPVGTHAWVELEIPDIEVVGLFYVHIYTDSPYPGLHIGADDSAVNEHSNVTVRKAGGTIQILNQWPYMPTLWFGDKSKVNWMIRVIGTAMVPENAEEGVKAPNSETQTEQTSSTVSQQGNCQCPRGNPLPQIQITYYPYSASGWTKVPSVTISAAANDHRIQLVKEAIEFWNQQLAEIGSSFRFGSVNHTTQLIPDSYLIQYSNSMLQGGSPPSVPAIVSTMSGDIIISLSDAEFVSWAQYPRTGKSIIAIRNCKTSPLNVTNVPRNLIAHELGHALGLGHNNDVTKLMCGRPADCRPPDFYCDCEQFFPITDKEKETLLKLYPASWKPTQ